MLYSLTHLFSLDNTLGILTTTPSNGVAVPDATMLPVFNTSDVMDLMQIGLNNRAVSATAMNERSSRSHSVLSIHVKGKDLQAGTTLFGNLHLVDLAGSERIDRSEVTGTALKEAQHINKSLSALGDVIFALAQKSTHVPYRNSKLTQLLQSSLGGQAKTLMFVQLNPDATSFSESLSTLKFAERVSGIELGAAKSNPGKDVKELMEQLASLKDTIANKDEEIERLQVLKGGGGGHPPPARLRTRRSASGEKGLGLTSEKDSETGGDSESRYSDNYMSDGEASVGTEPESVHDDAGGGGRGSSAEKRTAGPKGLTKARSLQRLTESRPSTTVTVSRDHLKGSTSVKKTTAGSSSSSTLQKPTSASRSRRP
ncbi:Kinesin-like protein KIN-14P [Linum grandiflorum]